MELVGHFLKAKNDRKSSISVFLDLSKAFDTLDHAVLVMELERYGIRGHLLDWFKSYLSGRSLVAKVPINSGGVIFSERHEITYGMAQGSCLGSLLYLVFCNNIYMLPLLGKLILFTHDTTLLEPIKARDFWNMLHHMI